LIRRNYGFWHLYHFRFILFFLFRLTDTISAAFSALYVVLVMYDNPVNTLVVRLKALAVAVVAAMIVNILTSVFYYKKVFMHKVIYVEAMTIYSLGKLHLQPIIAMQAQVFYELEMVKKELSSKIYFLQFFKNIEKEVEDMKSQVRRLQYLIHLYKHIVYQVLYPDTQEERYYAKQFIKWLGSLHLYQQYLGDAPAELREALEPTSTHLLEVLSEVLAWRRASSSVTPFINVEEVSEQEVGGLDPDEEEQFDGI